MRLLGVATVSMVVVFVVSPQYLLTFGQPVLFRLSLRYAAPALVLGAVLSRSRWLGGVGRLSECCSQFSS